MFRVNTLNVENIAFEFAFKSVYIKSYTPFTHDSSNIEHRCHPKIWYKVPIKAMNKRKQM